MSKAGRAATLGAMAAASCLLAGCDGTYDLPADVRWQSAHFDYLTRAGDSQICPDVLGLLEQHLALLQDYLGFAWAPGAKVTYEKMRDLTDYTQHGGCLPESGGCTLESTVVSPEGMDLHELVHAYLWTTGFPPPVLIEGAAVALACSPSFSGQRPAESWDQLAALGYGETDRAEVYIAGGWLVGYLLRAYDPRLFTTLYSRMAFDADADAMDAVFREVYGQSLAAIWAAALAGPTPHQVCLWQCSRPPMPLDGSKVATDRVCGLDVFHSLTLATPSVVALTSSMGAGAQIETCDQTALYPDWAVPGALNLFALPPGGYFVATDGAAGTMALDGSLSSVVTPTCAEATNLAPFAGFAGFTLSGPNISSQWYLPLPPPPAGTSMFDAGGSTMTVCGSCDPASCAGWRQFGSWTWAPGQTVSVAVDPFPPGSWFRIFLDWY